MKMIMATMKTKTPTAMRGTALQRRQGGRLGGSQNSIFKYVSRLREMNVPVNPPVIVVAIIICRTRKAEEVVLRSSQYQLIG